jgi:glutaredoxin
MEFTKPADSGFTIYSKSGCVNCLRVKNFLEVNNISFLSVDCDDYLLEDKKGFVLFLCKAANEELKVFPIVFNNGTFIGGYLETKDYIERINSFDSNLNF